MPSVSLAVLTDDALNTIIEWVHDSEPLRPNGIDEEDSEDIRDTDVRSLRHLSETCRIMRYLTEKLRFREIIVHEGSPGYEDYIAHITSGRISQLVRGIIVMDSVRRRIEADVDNKSVYTFSETFFSKLPDLESVQITICGVITAKTLTSLKDCPKVNGLQLVCYRIEEIPRDTFKFHKLSSVYLRFIKDLRPGMITRKTALPITDILLGASKDSIEMVFVGQEEPHIDNLAPLSRLFPPRIVFPKLWRLNLNGTFEDCHFFQIMQTQMPNMCQFNFPNSHALTIWNHLRGLNLAQKTPEQQRRTIESERGRLAEDLKKVEKPDVTINVITNERNNKRDVHYIVS